MRGDEARELQEGLAEWARAEPSCRALALVGSWARDSARDDSDLDIMFLTARLDTWASNSEWLRDLLRRIGHEATSLHAETYGVARCWRAWLVSGGELEIGLADLNWARTSPVDDGTRRVVLDGMRVLVDKDGLLRALIGAVLHSR